MTFAALYMQESFDASVSQDRNKGLNARRTIELVAFYSVDFLNRFHRSTRFTREQFDFRFWRTSRLRIEYLIVHSRILP